MSMLRERLDPQSLLNIIPSPIEKAALNGYYRYISLKADQEHTSIGERFSTHEGATDHVLVIVLDALRPDFVPDLDFEFTRAVAAGTWTFPSVTSLQTGLYPHEHESVAHTHPDDDQYVMPEQAIPDYTISSVLESAGYETYGGFAFMTPFLASRGWYQKHRVYQDTRAEQVISDFQAWRNGRDQTFGYLHLGDLHAPIEPPAEYVERYNVDTSIRDLERLVRYTDDFDGSEECEKFREERLKLYAAALAYVEDVLEPFLEEVSQDTTIVITGDHGEAHWEHFEVDQQFTDSRPNYGVGHGGTPFDMTARVPLSFFKPTGSLTPEGGHPSLCDVPAAICKHVLNESPFGKEDWSVPIPDSRTVFCEATRYGAERKAAYRGTDKVIHGETDEVTLAATVKSEGGEIFNQISVSSQHTSELVQSLPDYWEDGNISHDTDRMVEDQLSALGYK
ncbi:arylsulfatase [Haloferax sp. Atlit-12N]|uniref:sulfatase-like hydrolase/transferase n=1 Tax=Haloferax sp. Atlit-12N TaxID=2077203 RepID=UPI000E2899C5|nr:sulfatase-like hydrolase/transferase [Haloferax sp. Atlit-12N]RDZ63870.1 arylsulfatase [Haloferax sp. Atlit-12N]